MNRFIKLLSVLIGLTIGLSSTAQNISNKGKDFWTAYGHHEYFESDNSQNMTLYLSVDELPAGVQYATVTVTMDSSKPTKALWWTRTYRIPRNTVVSLDNNDPNIFSYSPLGPNGALPWGPIPKGNVNPNQAQFPTSVNYDNRLYGIPPPTGNGGDGHFTGRGIHITSDYDIVVYAHIYSQTSSGATMLLPTNSWGYNYTAINSRQLGYQPYDFSYFFVIASEDSTTVKITPTKVSRTGKPANTPFTVTLNKGGVYQYISYTNPTSVAGGFSGEELTNSKIESVPNASGRCKKIAVFCGSSRTEGEIDCGSGGRDNDMQQCFPEHTWGRRYATAPFSNNTGGNITPSAFMTTIYKVISKEDSTFIRINNGIRIYLPVGSVYKFSNSTPNLIEANNPIQVAQFMGGGCTSNDGDPEMVYLSPIEQAIPKIGMYKNIFTSIDVNYMTLIIPDSGLVSLKIDGAGFPNYGGNAYTTNHPNLPGFKVVVKGWVGQPNGKGQTIVSSNARFNTIVYGLGGAESYAYVGGAFLNNIAATSSVYNRNDTIQSIDSINITNHTFLYGNDPVNIRANVAFQPRKIEWLFNKIDTTKAHLIRVCDGAVDSTVIDTTSGGYTYVPPFNFTGYDTFYIKGCDATNANCVQQMHIVKVGTPFTANTNIIYLTTAYNTNKATSASAEAAPSGGRTPYTYANVNSAGVVGIRSNKQCRVLVVGTNYNYIPTPGFAGVDTFYIRVCDNSSPTNCSTQMHIITVGVPFSGDTIIMRNATDVNTTINGNAVAEINAVGGVTPYTYQVVDGSKVATATSNNGAAVTVVAASGAYTYIPVTGFTGTDTFYVKLCDASVVANCLTQMHIVTVGNPFTVANSIANHTTTLNKLFTINTTEDIKLAGGVGPYGIQLVNASNVVVATSNKGATVTINNVNGKVIYTPINAFSGDDSIYVKVCDASATPNCATQLHIISITNNFVGNTTEVLKFTVTNTQVDGSSKNEINATGGIKNYRYRNVNALGVLSDSSINKGVIKIDSITGIYTYTPKLDFYGVDTFFIRVCDSSAVKNCLTQTHIVFVIPGKTYSIALNKQVDGNAL